MRENKTIETIIRVVDTGGCILLALFPILLLNVIWEVTPFSGKILASDSALLLSCFLVIKYYDQDEENEEEV